MDVIKFIENQLEVAERNYKSWKTMIDKTDEEKKSALDYWRGRCDAYNDILMERSYDE